jgi:hypothetical protein
MDASRPWLHKAMALQVNPTANFWITLWRVNERDHRFLQRRFACCFATKN